MEPLTWGLVGTLAGAIVGATASIITTSVTTRNTRLLQEDAASAERRERSSEFQKNNLIELQDYLFNAIRLVTRAHLEDIEAFRRGDSETRLHIISEGLDQELTLNSRKVAVLTERIADQSLRDSINELRKAMENVLIAMTESESFSSIHTASDVFNTTMKKLGTVLRSHY